MSFSITIDFKGSHYPKEVILYAALSIRYAVSYRDLEEIMAKRGVAVDRATLNRWVVKYSPLIAGPAERRKSVASSSWRMDETYVQVKGKWTYFYRTVDKFGKTLDFMLSEHRDEAAASALFARVIDNKGWPEKVVIDKSSAHLAGLRNINCPLLLHGWLWLIEILQVKYLNNTTEQDHRFIKKLTCPIGTIWQSLQRRKASRSSRSSCTAIRWSATSRPCSGCVRRSVRSSAPISIPVI